MKYVYSISDNCELERYQLFVEKHARVISEYVGFISEYYDVKELPEYIVFSNLDMATKVHKMIPVPAYTNEIRTVITPEISVWKKIYLRQLDHYKIDSRVQFVRNYYESMLSENHILQILGHELLHQSELFVEDFNNEDSMEEGIWFEEGMVEYISRKYFLTEEEYAIGKKSNQLLSELFEEYFRTDSIECFGQSTFDGSYGAIFYEYWRSFLAVDFLVHKRGSVEKVFQRYHQWDKQGRVIPLSRWFEME